MSGSCSGTIATGQDKAVTFSAEAYTSVENARAERGKLWRWMWLQAGRIEDLPEPGSYITFNILDDLLTDRHNRNRGHSIPRSADTMPVQANTKPEWQLNR